MMNQIEEQMVTARHDLEAKMNNQLDELEVAIFNAGYLMNQIEEQMVTARHDLEAKMAASTNALGWMRADLRRQTKEVER